MAIDPEEWLRQADYDIDTAQDMLEKGRNFYVVFMCHLAVEKALKGLFWKKLGIIPPKTHDLMHLLRRIGLQPSAELKEFFVQLTEAQVATRYPEDFRTLQKEFHKTVVIEIMNKSKEAIEWIKKQF